MASLVGKAAAPVAKKILRDKVTDYTGAGSDPYHEYKLVNGKMKKVKKEIPDFIPAHDAEILGKAKKRARRLDQLIKFGPFHFGISTFWGLLPEVGDFIDLCFAVRLAMYCNKIQGGLPLASRFWIYLVIAGDFLAGLLPVLGDLADAAIKANVCTVTVLEKHLIKVHDPYSDYNKKRRKQGLPAPPLPVAHHYQHSEKPQGKAVHAHPARPPPAYDASLPQPGMGRDTRVPLRFKQPPPPPALPPGASQPQYTQRQHQQQSRFGRYAGPALEAAKPLAKPALQGAYAYAVSRKDGGKGASKTMDTHPAFI